MEVTLESNFDLTLASKFGLCLPFVRSLFQVTFYQLIEGTLDQLLNQALSVISQLFNYIMRTLPECAFNNNPHKKCIFIIFHYGAKPCPNFDQLLVNFVS